VKDPRKVTPAEFAIIEVLWAHARDLPVSAVKDELAPRRNLAYTTVMTLLDKMRRKGSVKRRKRGKAYYYSPTVKRQEVLNFMVQEFANSYCHGSRRGLEPFVQERHVAGGGQLRMSSPAGYPDLDVELL
jgi:predicted transcriptional regulator